MRAGGQARPELGISESPPVLRNHMYLGTPEHLAEPLKCLCSLHLRSTSSERSDDCHVAQRASLHHYETKIRRATFLRAYWSATCEVRFTKPARNRSANLKARRKNEGCMPRSGVPSPKNSVDLRVVGNSIIFRPNIKTTTRVPGGSNTAACATQAEQDADVVF